MIWGAMMVAFLFGLLVGFGVAAIVGFLADQHEDRRWRADVERWERGQERQERILRVVR